MEIRKFLLCAFMTLLMSVSSMLCVYLPFTPIPATPQVFVCLVSGALLGGVYGALSMLFYVLAGAFGLPVFAGMGSGIVYLFGPTCGFIIGFIPSSYLAGKLTRCFYRRGNTHFVQFAAIFVAMAISLVLLYFFGILYFSVLTGSGILKAVTLAGLPFIWLDLLKITLAAIAVKQLFLIAIIDGLR